MDHQHDEDSLNTFEENESILSPRNIFFHFVDHEFLSLTYLDKAPFDLVLQQMRRAMVVVLLVADNHVYMPASAYFESDYARNLFNWFLQFRQFGILRLIGGAFSVGDFVEAKRSQYAKDHDRYPRYFSDREVRRLLGIDTNWLRRLGSATRDIKIGWSLSVSKQEKIWDSLAHRHDMSSIARLEAKLLAVPERLGNVAFIADYVLPLLQIPNISSQDTNEINAFITQQYIYSYLNELHAFCLVDLPFADSRPVLGELRRYISYQKLLHLWKLLGIDDFLLHASDSELISIRISEAWSMFLYQYCWPHSLQSKNKLMEMGNQRRIPLRASFRDSVEDLDGLIRRVETIVGLAENSNGLEGLSERRFIMSQNLAKKPIMFIVHGHDEKTKLEVKNYLQNTLHLPEPIILHEQPSLGKTVIEKFETYGNRADGAIILLTPDDQWIKEGTNEEIRRARQNVIFELGYFYAKFGRESSRVLVLYKGKLDLPSDISGPHSGAR